MKMQHEALVQDLCKAMERPLFVSDGMRSAPDSFTIISREQEVGKWLHGPLPGGAICTQDWCPDNLKLDAHPLNGISPTWSIIDEFLDELTSYTWKVAGLKTQFRTDWEHFTREFIKLLEFGWGGHLENGAFSSDFRDTLQWADYSSRIFFCWRYLIPMTPKYKDRQIAKPSDIDPEDDIVASQILAAFRAGYMPCGWDGPFPFGRVVAFRPDNADELPWVKAWREAH